MEHLSRENSVYSRAGLFQGGPLHIAQDFRIQKNSRLKISSGTVRWRRYVVGAGIRWFGEADRLLLKCQPVGVLRPYNGPHHFVSTDLGKLGKSPHIYSNHAHVTWTFST